MLLPLMVPTVQAGWGQAGKAKDTLQSQLYEEHSLCKKTINKTI